MTYDIDTAAREYERIERYERDAIARIHEQHRRLIAEPSHVRRIYQIQPDGTQVLLPIERIAVTEDGTYVYVR